MFWQSLLDIQIYWLLSDRHSPENSTSKFYFLEIKLVANIQVYHGVSQQVFKSQVPLPWGKTKEPVGLDTYLLGFLTIQKWRRHVW